MWESRETRIIAGGVCGAPQTSHSLHLAADPFPAVGWQASELKECSMAPRPPARPSWVTDGSCRSWPRTRKARPAHRHSRLALTPNVLHSAQRDPRPLDRDGCRPIASLLLETQLPRAVWTPPKEIHTSLTSLLGFIPPASAHWASFIPSGPKTRPRLKDFQRVYLDSYGPAHKLDARQRKMHIREQRRHRRPNLNYYVRIQPFCPRCVPLL